MVEISTPIDAIEGIGPATAAKLADSGLHTVFDLLRAPPSVLHGAVRSTASLEQVQAWCAMASLLLVEGMTPQWAEALYRGGVESLTELAGNTPDELGQIFADAEAAGVIPAAPPDGSHWALIQDATALNYTGLLMGTVLDPDGEPVVGATATCGYVDGTTNDEGRFLLARLRLGIRPPLVISHSDYRTLTVDDPPLSSRHGLATVSVFAVRRRSNVVPSAGRVMSEIDGDAVPVPNGHRMSEATLADSELEDGDVLMVHSLYARSPDAKLVSRFKRYQDGEFLVRSFKVPLARLPDGVAVRQSFLFSEGMFQTFPPGPDALRREIAKRAVRKQFAGVVLGPDEEERAAATPERLDALANAGLFRGRF